MNFCKLSEILEYRNQNVIDRYCEDFKATTEEAELLFKEMLQFLWISQKNILEKKSDPSLDAHIAVYSEMTAMDNMWHTFILFTQDYTDFSHKYFGHYAHHQPNTKDEPISTPEEFEKQFSAFLSYAYDHLGEQILKRWFPNYC